MEKRNKTPLIVALVVVCAAVAAFAVYRAQTVKRFHVSGTITLVDAANNQASIEFEHPETGDPMEITGALDPSCEILLDGKPAKLADISAGDSAEVFAVWNKRTHRPDPQRILVTSAKPSSSDTE